MHICIWINYKKRRDRHAICWVPYVYFGFVMITEWKDISLPLIRRVSLCILTVSVNSDTDNILNKPMNSHVPNFFWQKQCWVIYTNKILMNSWFRTPFASLYILTIQLWSCNLHNSSSSISESNIYICQFIY